MRGRDEKRLQDLRDENRLQNLEDRVTILIRAALRSGRIDPVSSPTPAAAGDVPVGDNSGSRTRQDDTWEAPHAGVLQPPPAGFVRWVAWLVDAYALADRWPLCWYRHPGLVAELRGLWKWYQALNTELAVNPSAISSWHDALWRTTGRALQPVTQRCLAEHRDTGHVDLQAWLHDIDELSRSTS
jgi:hypothetical protein